MAFRLIFRATQSLSSLANISVCGTLIHDLINQTVSFCETKSKHGIEIKWGELMGEWYLKKRDAYTLRILVWTAMSKINGFVPFGVEN